MKMREFLSILEEKNEEIAVLAEIAINNGSLSDYYTALVLLKLQSTMGHSQTTTLHWLSVVS